MRVKMWKISERTICALVLIGYSLLICLQSPLNMWATGVSAPDSSVFRYMAFAMEKGVVPYKDSFDHKGPLTYFLNYLGNVINERFGIWIIECLLLTITIFFLYRIARLFCGRIYGVFSVITVVSLMGIYFQGGNFTEEYALPFMTISIYYFIEYLKNRKLNCLKIFFCGCAFSAVLMLRPNMIAPWIGFIIVIVAMEISQRQWTNIFKEILFFGIGTIVVICPFMIYLLIEQAIKEFFEVYLLFNFRYQSALPGKDILVAFDYFFSQPIVYLAVLSFVLQYINVIKEKDSNRKWIIQGNALAFIVTYILLCIPGRGSPHYGMVIIPVLIFPICMMESLIQKAYKSNSFVWIVLIFWMVVEILYPNELRIIGNLQLKSNEDYKYQYVLDIIEETCEPEDKISVFGNKDYIYFESNKLSASRYSYQFPIVYVSNSIYEEYKSDIQTTMPKIIFINEDDERYKNDFLEFIASLGYEAVAESVYLCNNIKGEQ